MFSQAVNGSVKAGKVNCESHSQICQKAGIGSYPTVRVYQNPSHGAKKVIKIPQE